MNKIVKPHYVPLFYLQGILLRSTTDAEKNIHQDKTEMQSNL